MKQPMVSDKYSETENVERQLVVSRIQCQMIVALNRNAVPTYVSNVVTVSRDFSVFVSYMQRGWMKICWTATQSCKKDGTASCAPRNLKRLTLGDYKWNVDLVNLM